ncbi:MAG: ATP-binding protein [Magnetospirillum sp. WYHS-4]
MGEEGGVLRVELAKRVSREVRLAAALVAATVMVLSGWQTWSHHDDQMAAAERLASALVRAAEERVGGSLRSIDLLLQDIAKEVAAQPLPDEVTFTAYLTARAAAYPEAKTVFVVGQEGISRYATASGSTNIHVADRAYFLESRASKDDPSLYLSEPLTSRALGTKVIFAARPIVDDGGDFKGVVVATLNPRFFLEAVASITAGGSARGLLMHRDGTVYAREPDPDKFLGVKMVNSPMLISLAKADSGTYRALSPFDGLDQIVAYRSLAHYPLVVGVGVPLDGFMAAWRRSAAITALVNALLAAVAFALAFVLDRRRDERLRSQALLENQQAELTRHAEALERSNAELRQLSHVAAHDLQEPLRNITNYLGLLERRHGSHLEGEARDAVDIAIEGSRRLHRLIRDLQEFSEIGVHERPAERIEVARLLRDALDALAPAIEASQARITHDSLPAVVADAALLGTLLMQLLRNALIFRRTDEPPAVHVSAVREGGEWVFSVADNGIGIDPDYHDRIFRIFQRLHAQESYEGTGIGLALCKKIVEWYGGRIWVESAEGQGSTFFFTLPAPE